MAPRPVPSSDGDREWRCLAIEYRDGGKPHRFEITAGQADWDEPTDRVHRAVNVGTQSYEEITIFFLDRPEAVPQPNAT